LSPKSDQLQINEEFDKRYFTILDFRNATDLFADKEFDGDPIRVKPIDQNTDLSNIANEIDDQEVIIDEISNEEICFQAPQIRQPIEYTEGLEKQKRQKIYVKGIDVSLLVSREMYFDRNGQSIITSLTDHTKGIIQEKYVSLNDFLKKWNSADRKEAIIKELEEQGILVEALSQAVDRELDLFDLICHIVYDQPPLTRKERAENVKKRNYFTKYGEQARKVLESLLNKYADEGIENIESMEVLRVSPLVEFGSVMEIINIFGGKEQYLQALRELENELYKGA
jgi:type I restriction enzyme, R subunit